MENTLQLENFTVLVEIHVNHLKKYFNTEYKDIIKLLLANSFKIENIDHRINDGVFIEVDVNDILVDKTILLCTKKPNITID